MRMIADFFGFDCFDGHRHEDSIEKGAMEAMHNIKSNKLFCTPEGEC